MNHSSIDYSVEKQPIPNKVSLINAASESWVNSQ